MADSWDVNSGDVSTLAVPINSTQTTGIKLAAISVNGSTLAWSTQSGGIILVTENVDGTIKREWINYTGGTENADSTFTLSGVTRGVDRDAATRTTATAGQSFNKGARVQLVVSHLLLNQKADVDRANTFTADQTFNDDILFTGTDKSGVNAKQLTTAERDAISSPNNGAVIYNTTTGQLNQYVGGAWTAVGDTGTVDATESAAGKVEISTKAENAAATATGGSGAVLVPSVEDMVQVSGDAGIAEGSIPVLNSSSKVDVTLLGTGSPSASNYLIGDGSWGTIASLATEAVFGDGSDGAFSESSGTTTIDAAGANVVVKQYTSFSLTGTASLTISNPATDGTILIIKTQGNFTNTSSGSIDMSEMGATGGAASSINRSSSGETSSNGTAGTNPFNSFGQPRGGRAGQAATQASGPAEAAASGGAGGGSTGTDGTASGSAVANGSTAAAAAGGLALTDAIARVASNGMSVSPGAGGASGGVAIAIDGYSSGTSTADSPIGGRGGGGLIIMCGGNYNDTGGTVDLSAGAGGNGTNANASATYAVSAAGGSGGGSGGSGFALVGGSITDAGTKTVSGGAGGTGVSTGASNPNSYEEHSNGAAGAAGAFYVMPYFLANS